MRAKVHFAHPSIRDHWVLKCLSRCLDQMVSLKRDPQCLSPQASLLLISRPTAVERKDWSTLSNPGIEKMNFQTPGIEPGPPGRKESLSTNTYYNGAPPNVYYKLSTLGSLKIIKLYRVCILSNENIFVPTRLYARGRSDRLELLVGPSTLITLHSAVACWLWLRRDHAWCRRLQKSVCKFKMQQSIEQRYAIKFCVRLGK
ncbi:uncharacterized protein TNCV_337351 [Trichonephila clavipes]|nr:uncharacterized protein TNCV_337351 [Trichonephila clavipes]